MEFTSDVLPLDGPAAPRAASEDTQQVLAADSPEFSVRLALSSEWNNVELMRGVVNRFVYTIFEDDEFGESVAMVSAELMENAIKYGYFGVQPEGRIGFELTSDREQVHVKVSNPTQPNCEAVSRLRERVEWLGQQQDARSAYAERMRAVFEGHVTHGGLGLVRIAYEGGCTIECRPQDERMEVVARFERASEPKGSKKEVANDS